MAGVSSFFSLEIHGAKWKNKEHTKWLICLFSLSLQSEWLEVLGPILIRQKITTNFGLHWQLISLLPVASAPVLLLSLLLLFSFLFFSFKLLLFCSINELCYALQQKYILPPLVFTLTWFSFYILSFLFGPFLPLSSVLTFLLLFFSSHSAISLALETLGTNIFPPRGKNFLSSS